MTILCSVINHVPSTARQQNQGLEFSMCHRCGCDLIRIEQSGEWIDIPKGFRVVWREGDTPAAAQSAQRLSPPRRRDPRSGRAAPRRDPRGRPLAGATSMFSVLANLRKLVAGEEDAERPMLQDKRQQVIRLPGAAH